MTRLDMCNASEPEWTPKEGELVWWKGKGNGRVTAWVEYIVGQYVRIRLYSDSGGKRYVMLEELEKR